MPTPNRLRSAIKRTSFLPIGLLVLALTVISATFAQRTGTASATPLPLDNMYMGTASMKMKVGSAYQVTSTSVCLVAITNAPGGDLVDVIIQGASEEGCLLPRSTAPQNPSSLFPPSDVFSAVTILDQALTGGLGWKNNPVKQTANQWQFQLAAPLDVAANVIVNGTYRPFYSGATLVVKFINNRQGIYFKLTGFVPTGPGGAKTSVEIEAVANTFDMPPTAIASSPFSGATGVLAGSTVTVFYDEPVNVDPAGAAITCTSSTPPASVTFNSTNANLTILGQGTPVITLVASPSLPVGGIWDCVASIDPAAVDDVDTVDPPANYEGSGISVSFQMEIQLLPPGPN